MLHLMEFNPNFTYAIGRTVESNVYHKNTAMRFCNISWKIYFVAIHIIISVR
jgi:hypothetical protein